MKNFVIVAAAIIAIVAGILLTGCRGKQYMTTMSVDSNIPDSTEMPEDARHEGIQFSQAEYVPGELICSVETEEEASAIAEMYSIRLKDFSYGVAVFYAGEEADIFAIIEEGNKKGYPTLEPNYIYTLDDEMTLN